MRKKGKGEKGEDGRRESVALSLAIAVQMAEQKERLSPFLLFSSPFLPFPLFPYYTPLAASLLEPPEPGRYHPQTAQPIVPRTLAERGSPWRSLKCRARGGPAVRW